MCSVGTSRRSLVLPPICCVGLVQSVRCSQQACVPAFAHTARTAPVGVVAGTSPLSRARRVSGGAGWTAALWGRVSCYLVWSRCGGIVAVPAVRLCATACARGLTQCEVRSGRQPSLPAAVHVACVRAGVPFAHGAGDAARRVASCCVGSVPWAKCRGMAFGRRRVRVPSRRGSARSGPELGAGWSI